MDAFLFLPSTHAYPVEWPTSLVCLLVLAQGIHNLARFLEDEAEESKTNQLSPFMDDIFTALWNVVQRCLSLARLFPPFLRREQLSPLPWSLWSSISISLFAACFHPR